MYLTGFFAKSDPWGRMRFIVSSESDWAFLTQHYPARAGYRRPYRALQQGCGEAYVHAMGGRRQMLLELAEQHRGRPVRITVRAVPYRFDSPQGRIEGTKLAIEEVVELDG